MNVSRTYIIILALPVCQIVHKSNEQRAGWREKERERSNKEGEVRLSARQFVRQPVQSLIQAFALSCACVLDVPLQYRRQSVSTTRTVVDARIVYDQVEMQTFLDRS